MSRNSRTTVGDCGKPTVAIVLEFIVSFVEVSHCLFSHASYQSKAWFHATEHFTEE